VPFGDSAVKIDNNMMTTNEQKELLDNFLDRWTIDNVKNLTLKEYVGLDNKDTFYQWVETKTRTLGSIKRLTSIKFGVNERKDSAKKPKNYKNDDKYSWLQVCGDNRTSAFEKTKQAIIQIIQLSEIGKFEQIDKIFLPDLFKWKVAFLYSNERLIEKYGEKNVILEENFVDIKLMQPEHISFFEVKSSSYASECIKEALGQILLYSFSDNDSRPKKHIVVGQYPATDNDNKFIDFLKNNLKLEFDYMNVDIKNDV
jgi:hypothetical protein